MFKVECPGCKAPYQVDERRVPASGLKMRCPKCGASFQVEAPDDGRRTGPSPVLGGAPPAAGAPPRPPAPARNAAARTIVGVAPSALGIDPSAPLPSPKAPAATPPGPPPRPVPKAPAAPPAGKAPLPAPSAKGKEPPKDPYGDADLPAVSGSSDTSDLPAPVAARPKPPLPAPAGRAAPAPPPVLAPPPVEVDLPAVPGRPKSAAPISLAPDEVELDADLPAIPRAASPDFGLPSPAAARPAPSPKKDLDWDLPEVGSLPPGRKPSNPAGLELDLPDLSGAELPSPAGYSGLPAALAGLPSPAASLPSLAAGLPAPAAGLPMPAAGLPMPAAGLPSPPAGLPSPKPGALELGAELPSLAGGLPAHELPLVGAGASPRAGIESAPPAAAGFGEIDLDMLGPGPSLPPLAPGFGEAPPRSGGFGAAPPVSSGFSEPPRSGGFGEIELPPPAPSQKSPNAFDDALEADPFGEASIPSEAPRAAAPASSAAVVRSGGGGTSYGEVNLDGGGGDVGMEAPPLHTAPPGPDESMEFGAIPQEVPRAAAVAAPAQVPSHAPQRRRRWPARTFGALLVVAVGGGSLSFVESLGPYGAYWISDQLNAGEHARKLESSVAETRKLLARDTWPAASRAFEDLEAARAGAKRYPAFASYLALTAYLSELRFGSAPAMHARASVLLDEIAGKNPEYAALARAARPALEGDLARAQQSVSSLPAGPEAAVLKAELALRGKDAAAKVAAWQSVEAAEPSARAAFGLARAKYAADDAAGAEQAAKQALARNAEHVGARILLARIGAAKAGQEANSVKDLEALLKQQNLASPEELAQAETLLGDVHLGRSHVSLAIEAYGRALKIRPAAAGALAGLGEALFRAGRYAEALARFEASAQALPGDVLAEVGVAKSKLMLERIEEATAALAKLAAADPKQPLVALWYGRALEAAGEKDRASAVYHAAIDGGSRSPAIVEVHIALATLQNQRGQAEEARKTLAAARDKLPGSAIVHRALGELALAQGKPADAIRELEQALKIDPDDLPSAFQLGVALRRNQNFDGATKQFERVAGVDREYPGLALERGLIFEATGKTAEALKAYRDALAKAPKDVDLMLRVGCGSVTVGELDAADELLRKVLVQRPNSAEANNCLGRALLARDKLADAQRLFDRAVEIDPTRAVFHFCSGWAANEAGNFGKAERALEAALKLDNTLGDAYWQRGVLRQKQGAVRDAVTDLLQALKLNPTRSEAHAALADVYYDLGREHDALAQWQKAVQAQPDNAGWRFRYGKLLVTNQMNDAGRAELERAIAWAEKSEAPPRWLWEAHHFIARALGNRPEAAPHWEQFLRLGPRDSPYRREARQALERLGKPWSGN